MVAAAVVNKVQFAMSMCCVFTSVRNDIKPASVMDVAASPTCVRDFSGAMCKSPLSVIRLQYPISKYVSLENLLSRLSPSSLMETLERTVDLIESHVSVDAKGANVERPWEVNR